MDNKDTAFIVSLVEAVLESEKKAPAVIPQESRSLQNLLDLKFADQGMDDSDLLSALVSIIDHTPKTASPAFFNQLFGGRQPKAVAGEVLAAMLNNSMYTYKVGGPMILMEQAILKEIIRLVGYPQDSHGTIATGGSMTNFMAMLMARDRYDHHVPNRGIHKRLVCYTSKESHYSIGKNAAMIGIGRDAVRYIDCDDQGRMQADALRSAIQNDINEGLCPFFVNATAGTTVLGAFDPIDDIANVLKEYPDIWLHIDGAYCGAVIWSKTYRHLVSGVHRSDSFCVNAHKMLGTPLTCSILITKHKDALYRSFATDADYLYQTDDDELNPGKVSFQCGRRNDALKLFVLWKSIGNTGIEAIVDRQFQLADVARDYVNRHKDYTLYSFPDSVGICFNYKDFQADDLCLELYKQGALVVGHGTFNGQQFIRLVTVNAGNQPEDILQFFTTLERVADSLNL